MSMAPPSADDGVAQEKGNAINESTQTGQDGNAEVCLLASSQSRAPD